MPAWVDKINMDADCWEWTGYVNHHGYGSYHPKKGVKIQAHRLVWEEVVGPVPEGLDLDHLCRNRKCVNPDHLEAVTRRENLVRGAGWAGQNARKTHCVHGHEYTPENTINRRGTRECRECTNARRRVDYVPSFLTADS